jgi:hypothetical protein
MNVTETPLRLTEAAKQFFFEEHGLRAHARGNSMAPFIRDGQSVLISAEIGRLRCGTCYFFFYENQFILHRLVRRTKKGVVFMGDNSDTIEIVNPSCIVARLNLHQPLLPAIIITLINNGYYIIKKTVGWRMPGRIRKRFIKLSRFFTQGVVP